MSDLAATSLLRTVLTRDKKYFESKRDSFRFDEFDFEIVRTS